MHLQLPPAIPYAVGAVLVVFGSLRALHLGWQRRDREPDDERPARSTTPRYHLMWGTIQVVMGLGLLISTYYQSRQP